MADPRGALAYPVRGPGGERPLLATWVCLLVTGAVPLLRFLNVLGLLGSLLVTVPVVGYLVRVLAASERGDPAPRFLVEPVSLLRRGGGGLVLTVVYLAIPFALLAITVYGAIWTDRVPDLDSFSTLTIYAGSTMVIVLSMLGAYLLPVGLANYGRTGSLRAGVSRSGLRPILTNAAYFAGWTAAFGVVGFVTAIAVAVYGTTQVGPLVATGLLAYTLLFTVHVLGRALARTR